MARSGLFRDRITFQRMADSVDAFGNTTGAWSDLASRHADFRERLGKETIEGGALQDVAMATMRVRADSVTSAITAADRVTARGITWAIRSIMQVEATDELLEMLLEKGIAS
jgi:SPP1 family predicted phage head-tail adaptor